MTIKQKAFCDYYIETGNASEAARRAGYSKKYANSNVIKLQQNPAIRAYIDERLKQIEDSRIADAAEVLKYLTRVLRGESEAEIVVVEGSGDGYSAARRLLKKPEEKERLKAAELLAKRYGILTESVKLQGALPVIISGDDEIPE